MWHCRVTKNFFTIKMLLRMTMRIEIMRIWCLTFWINFQSIIWVSTFCRWYLANLFKRSWNFLCFLFFLIASLNSFLGTFVSFYLLCRHKTSEHNSIFSGYLALFQLNLYFFHYFCQSLCWPWGIMTLTDNNFLKESCVLFCQIFWIFRADYFILLAINKKSRHFTCLNCL